MGVGKPAAYAMSAYGQPGIYEAGGTRQLIIWHPTALTSLDPATGVAYGADYVVGPPRDDGDVKRKMREDFLLLLRAQPLLPAPTKALLKFYAKAWDEAPPAHWSDVIRGLCDEGLVRATRDAAGEHSAALWPAANYSELAVMLDGIGGLFTGSE